MFLNLIQIPITWNKVNSHIEGRVYKEGTGLKRDAFAICLNIQVDKWAGEIRKT